MPNYVDMFRRVTQSVRCDYALYAQKEALDQGMRNIDDLTFLIMHSMVSDFRFARIVGNYLDAFKDPGLKLHVDHDASAYKDYDHGIEVRRYGDALYVEHSAHPLVEPGDRIVKMDYWSIPEMAERRGDCLYGSSPERERWESQLHFCGVVSLERDGERIDDVRLAKGSYTTPVPSNAISTLDDGTVLVTLWSLDSACGVEELVARNEGILRSAKRIVIDVRKCTGSCDEALLALSGLVADDGMRIADFVEESCLINYSEGNCRLLEESLALSKDPWAASLLMDARAHRGEGLVPFDCDIPEALRKPIAPMCDARVVVLADVRCEGAAETLAEMAKASDRCALVGRNTAGLAGSFFPVAMPVGEHFWVEYPIACYSSEARARHFCGSGVSVDVHIPWTPEQLSCDVDLEAGLEFLSE